MYGNLKKMNLELYKFFKILGTGILKNESETLRTFGNLVYGNFLKKLSLEFWRILELLEMIF